MCPVTYASHVNMLNPQSICATDDAKAAVTKNKTKTKLVLLPEFTQKNHVFKYSDMSDLA